MKVALLSESPADETALRVLVAAVLRCTPQFVAPGFRARGWPHVAQVMPLVLRHLHFNTDTDVLVVTVDSDDSVVHTAEHDRPNYFHPRCRMCQLRAVHRQTTKKFPAAHGRAHVLRTIGVAVPAIEAWYLSGRDGQVTEQAWLDGQQAGRPPYSRAELKVRVYGTDRPSLKHEIECALREVHRIGPDTRRLEYDFPGFSAFAEDLRSAGPAVSRGVGS
jgi:hypothetical protein